MNDTVRQAREEVIEKYSEYIILKNIMRKDYYFDLLSCDAKYNLLFGKTKLTDILDKISKFREKGEISGGDFVGLYECINKLANRLESKYDAIIFSNIVLEYANNLNEGDKEDISNFLKIPNLGKKEKLSDLSMKEKKALYFLAEVHEDMRLFFKDEAFLPSDTSELFILYQYGRLLTSSQKKDRIAARGKILSLAEEISEADQCNILFELTGGEEDVYFSKNFRTNEFQIKNVLNDNTLLEERVVRKLPYNQSSLFGNLLFQAILKGEMNSKESGDMKNLFRAGITNLYNMAKKGCVECLEYIIPLSYDVNICGLEDRSLNISEIDGEDISNLGGIGKITVLKLAKAYFNGEKEVIEKLEYLERIHEKYRTKGITAVMSVALDEEDEEMGVKSDYDEKDEKSEKGDSRRGAEESSDSDRRDNGNDNEFGIPEYPTLRSSLLASESNKKEKPMASSSSSDSVPNKKSMGSRGESGNVNGNNTRAAIENNRSGIVAKGVETGTASSSSSASDEDGDERGENGSTGEERDHKERSRENMCCTIL